MSITIPQAGAQIVDQDGRLTFEGHDLLLRMARLLVALEERVAALEP